MTIVLRFWPLPPLLRVACFHLKPYRLFLQVITLFYYPLVSSSASCMPSTFLFPATPLPSAPPSAASTLLWVLRMAYYGQFGGSCFAAGSPSMGFTVASSSSTLGTPLGSFRLRCIFSEQTEVGAYGCLSSSSATPIHEQEDEDWCYREMQKICHHRRNPFKTSHSILWVTDFPMFEWNDSEHRYEVELLTASVG